MKKNRIILLLLITIFCGSTLSTAENQSRAISSKKNESIDLDCSGIKGRIKKECRALTRTSSSTPRSAAVRKPSVFQELDIKETISITSSVKLPEDI